MGQEGKGELLAGEKGKGKSCRKVDKDMEAALNKYQGGSTEG